MADASLYNGQPTGTGSSCPSARLTSCTPSISEEVENGVSVGNALVKKKQWFVLRVSYGRMLKSKGICLCPQYTMQAQRQNYRDQWWRQLITG